MEDDNVTKAMKAVKQFRALALTVLIVLLFGTIFYHYVEGWNWLNSLYFCVITLATVGYGDFTPHTPAGKIFTIFYVLLGIGLLAAFANNLLKSRLAHRFLKHNANLNTDDLNTDRITKGE